MSGQDDGSFKDRAIDGVNSCMRARDSYIIYIERGTMCFAILTMIIVFTYLSAVGGFFSHELLGDVNDFR